MTFPLGGGRSIQLSYGAVRLCGLFVDWVCSFASESWLCDGTSGTFRSEMRAGFRGLAVRVPGRQLYSPQGCAGHHQVCAECVTEPVPGAADANLQPAVISSLFSVGFFRPFPPVLARISGMASRAPPLQSRRFRPRRRLSVLRFLWWSRERSPVHFLYWRGVRGGRLWLATPVAVAIERCAATKNRPRAVAGAVRDALTRVVRATAPGRHARRVPTLRLDARHHCDGLVDLPTVTLDLAQHRCDGLRDGQHRADLGHHRHLDLRCGQAFIAGASRGCRFGP